MNQRLLLELEKEARSLGLKTVFVLSTQTAHWFLRQGFVEVQVEELPASRKALYNYQRNSKIFYKKL